MTQPKLRSPIDPARRAEARRIFEETGNISAVARGTGISRETIRSWIARESWRISTAVYFKDVQRRNAALARKRVIARKRYEEGIPIDRIATTMKLNPVTLRRIAKRDQWMAPQSPDLLEEAA